MKNAMTYTLNCAMISVKTIVNIFLVFQLFILLSSCNVNNRTVKKPQYIIFISLDTLRADHLGCYGYDKNTSPAIDRIAEEGTLFENAFVQRGLTQPSLASIMTSLYINQHKLLDHIYSSTLSEDNTTLAEYLSRNDYVTKVWCSNLLVTEETGILQGFKEVVLEEDEDKMTSSALKWIADFNSERPKDNFFLWIHYIDPHAPYTARKPYIDQFESSYDGNYGDEILFTEVDDIFLQKRKLSEEDLEHIISLYDSQIARVDDLIKQITDKLKDLNIYDDTLLVFFSDHGEELYEHNNYMEHYRSVYEDVLHIPLIVRYPGVVPVKKRIDNVVEAIDIMPTILEMSGISPDNKISGLSLKPLWEGKEFKKNFAVSEFWNKIFTLRTDKWAYIWNPEEIWPEDTRFTGGEYPVQREELYNIIDDKYQQNNLVSEKKETADILNKQISEWIIEALDKDQQPVKSIPLGKIPLLDEKKKKALKSLGYIQ